MKNPNRTVLMIAVSVTLLAQPVFAFAMEREGRLTQVERKERDAPVIVKWIGTIEDDAGSHASAEHKLEFVRKDNGNSYDIIDNPALVKLHREKGENYAVEIVAEKTSGFLFWGGKLIVKNFKVVEGT